MSNQFGLQPEDTEYLDANYPGMWRLTSPQSGEAAVGLVIEDFPLTSGYTLTASVLMVIIPNGYPGTQIDMFYFDPPLQKANGESIEALVAESHFGMEWQRWSRHYNWNPGKDSIVSHIEYIKIELSDEAAK